MKRSKTLRPTHGITLKDVDPNAPFTPTIPSKKAEAAPLYSPRLTNTPKTSFWSRRGYLLLCFLIPAILVYLTYFARGVHPFGNGSVLVLDLGGQYVWFFEALRNFVRGDASLIYSFARALGGEFLGIYAYYLASPLSFLVALFPTERMLEALLVLFMLKAGLCGLSFGYYMHKTLDRIKPSETIAFSILYAMSSYAVVYQHNTMWIDAMIWLPMITLGIEALIKHGKFKLYTLSLAVALLSNFYIGYMLCIWCLIYFFLYYFGHSRKERNPLWERGHFLKSLLRMALYSLLAIGIAAVVLLSAYYALHFGKTTFTDTSWKWRINFNPLDFLYKLLPGAYDTVRYEGHPFIYCGVLTLLLLPAYFLSKKYPWRQKIFGALLIGVLIAGMTFNVTDLIWHGFQHPNWLNYRYSFLLCFCLCVFGCRALAAVDRRLFRTAAVTGAGLAILCFFLWRYNDGEYVKPAESAAIWFTLIAVAVYIVVLLLIRLAKSPRVMSAVLCGLITIEVFAAALFSMHALGLDVGYTGYSTYNDFLNSVRPITEEVQSSDDSFYRMEKTMFYLINDNMALDINGLSGSTSTLNYETVLFLNKMGYASSSHWSKYLGGTPVSDSLLGVKYVLSKNFFYSKYYEVYKTDEANGITAYYNPYALSLAYGVSDALLDFPLGYLSEESEENDSSKIAALKKKLNEWLNISETVNSAEYTDHYNSPFERLNAMVTAMLGEEKTVQIFVPISHHVDWNENTVLGNAQGHYIYKKIDADADTVLTYSLTMPVSAELYFYEPSDYPREVELTLHQGSYDFDKGTFNGHESQRIVSLGWQNKDTSLKLDLKLTGEDYYPMRKQKVFYYIDWAVFEDAMARLATDQYQITEFSDTSFKGTFTPSRDNELVLTTLAYDEGWEIRVDGKKVELEKALGALIAFRIEGEAGKTYTIEMTYRPKTLRVGLTVSAISIGSFLFLVLMEPSLKKIPLLRSVVSVPPRKKKRKKEGDDNEGEDTPAK